MTCLASVSEEIGRAGDVVEGEGEQSVSGVFALGELHPGFFLPGQTAETVQERGQPDFDEMHTPGRGEVGQGGITFGVETEIESFSS